MVGLIWPDHAAAVQAPTLLIVGGRDDVVLDLNRTAQERLRCVRSLGLTREQVAERAGMVPGFVEYLEERPSSLTQEVLLQLAAALEITVDELLGGTTDRPPGRTSSVSSSGWRKG